MKNVSWINRLKLRGSYGQTGNDGLSGYYPYQTLTMSALIILMNLVCV